MRCRSSHPPIKARTDKLTFGQYKGQSVSWILENDPDYIIWLYDESICIVDKKILNDAEKFSEEKHYCESMDGIDVYDWMDEPF